MQGAALEGRAYAQTRWLRFGITLAIALATYLLWSQALTSVALALAIYAVLSASHSRSRLTTMTTIGTPLAPSANRVMLLGSGELGKKW